jgi:hypothetical protein
MEIVMTDTLDEGKPAFKFIDAFRQLWRGGRGAMTVLKTLRGVVPCLFHEQL